MKKLLLLLVLVVAIGANVSAQTYEEFQRRTSWDIETLENRLDEVTDRIFYLEVVLKEKISEAQGAALKRLQKEKHFADEEGAKLREEKMALEVTISNLRNSALDAALYRAQTDEQSNLPEEMGPITYKRRLRAQVFKERVGASGEVKKYPGLLVNLKRGLGEVVTFKIYVKEIPDIRPLVYHLNPQERLWVNLAPGDYLVEVISGPHLGYVDVNVDPTVTDKWADGKSVYWSAIKLLSDR